MRLAAIVPARAPDLTACAVLADSWSIGTQGADLAVIVDHPDLVEPFRRALPGVDVGGPVELGVPAAPPPPAGRPDARWAQLTRARLASLEPGTVAVLLPPSALLLRPPDLLIAAAQEHGVALAGRGDGPLPGPGPGPTGDDVAALGAIHPGLLAAVRGDARAERFLDWWAQGARRSALVPTHWPSVPIVTGASVALGWWNAKERPLRIAADGVMAGDRPVTVVDFDGWRPAYPMMLHPDMFGLLSSDHPALRVLVEDYAARHAKAASRLGEVPSAAWPTDEIIGELLGEADPEEADAALRDLGGEREAFEARAAWPNHDQSLWGLNTYLCRYRSRRADLVVAFPDLDDRQVAAGYLEWARRDGVRQGVPRRYVEASLDDPVPVPTPRRRARQERGVNVVGPFHEEALGLAAIAREVADALEAAGLDVVRIAVDRRGHPTADAAHRTAPYTLTVLCVNADLVSAVWAWLDARLPARRHLAGVWWWELQEIPDLWLPAMELVDEIWAGTTFVAEAFARVFEGPVRLVPLGLSNVAPPGGAPPEVSEDPRPYVLATFDYGSVLPRKNPLGAIEAFQRSGLAPDVRLIVKSVQGDCLPRQRELVTLAALDAGPDAVTLLDRVLPRSEHDALVAGASAHLALHRSEGLGLTICEAMMRDVPVVATDYGGSTDLVDDQTGWPVRYTDGTVPEGCAPYPSGAYWAEPDLDAAATSLRDAVLGHSDERVARARRRAEERADGIRSGRDLAEAVSRARERTERRR